MELCPKTGIPLDTIALNYGITDAYSLDKFKSEYKSSPQYHIVSFMEFLKSNCDLTDLPGFQEKQSQANVGRRMATHHTKYRHGSPKKFNRAVGKERGQITRYSHHGGSSDSHTERRETGGHAISGLGGVVETHTFEIHSKMNTGEDGSSSDSDDEKGIAEGINSINIGSSAKRRHRIKRKKAQNTFWHRRKHEPFKGYREKISITEKEKQDSTVATPPSSDVIKYTPTSLSFKKKNLQFLSDGYVQFIHRIMFKSDAEREACQALFVSDLIESCHEKCAECDEKLMKNEKIDQDRLTKNIGAMLVDTGAAFCSLLESACIRQEKKVTPGSEEHRQILREWKNKGYRTDTNLLKQYSGANVAVSEYIGSSLMDLVDYAKINGTRDVRKEDTIKVKKAKITAQWKNVSSTNGITTLYPELKDICAIGPYHQKHLSQKELQYKKNHPDYHKIPTEGLAACIEEHEKDCCEKFKLATKHSDLIENVASGITTFLASRLFGKAHERTQQQKNTDNILFCASMLHSLEKKKNDTVDTSMGPQKINQTAFYDGVRETINALSLSDCVSNHKKFSKQMKEHIELTKSRIKNLNEPEDIGSHDNESVVIVYKDKTPHGRHLSKFSDEGFTRELDSNKSSFSQKGISLSNLIDSDEESVDECEESDGEYESDM